MGICGTARNGGSCQSLVYFVRAQAVLQSWVCVCVWFGHQQMILQPESIKPSIRNLIQHFEHSQGRVGLTDVGSCNKFPLYGAGGEGRWTGSRFSCRSSCCTWQYVLCKKTGRRREMEHGWQLPSGHSGAESRVMRRHARLPGTARWPRVGREGAGCDCEPALAVRQ